MDVRLHAFLADATPTMGVVVDDRVTPLASVEDFYRNVGRWTAEAARTVTGLRPIGELEPAVPVPETAKIICVALNYRMHADEGGGALPERPNLFARWWSTLVPDGTPIPVPVDEPGLDWEVELAAIIGSPLTAATPAAETMAAVLGYSVFNDVSARTHQRATSQWANGKNADQSGPVSSTIVTADEVDRDDLRLRTTLNGTVMQDGSTAEMAIKIPELLAYATRTISLRPGDLIATGTPAGVGYFRDPPVLMQPGDTITAAIDGIGSVSNPVVDAGHRH